VTFILNFQPTGRAIGTLLRPSSDVVCRL